MASTAGSRPSTWRRARRVWTARDRAPQTTGVLATAGGIVVAGAFDRYIRAYDDATGKVLWETRLNDVSSSSPITYSVGGKQYVAVVTGQGGFHAASYAVLVPELVEPARSRRRTVGVRAAVRASVVRPRNAKQESVDLPRVKRV